MYGIFTNICPKNHPNVGKYTIHGAYGIYIMYKVSFRFSTNKILRWFSEKKNTVFFSNPF